MKTYKILKASIWIVLVGCVLIGFNNTQAAPSRINFQGYLTDTSGLPAADGSYTMTFAIYEGEDPSQYPNPSGGWTETQTVSVRKGLYNVQIGSVTPLVTSLFTQSSTGKYYLGVTVGGESLSRQEITSVAFALNADTIDGKDSSEFVTFSNGQIVGGFGAASVDGIKDWNDISNACSGNGYTLLFGNANNGPGPGYYYHPFSFEYSSKNGSGNMTQLAIPYYLYGDENGANIYFRSRYSNTWSSWAKVITTDPGMSQTIIPGYVGIGTDSPKNILHVVYDQATPQLTLERTTSSVGKWSLGTGGYFGIWEDTGQTTPGSGPLRLYIASGGNVGIGTQDTINYKLNVNGPVNATDFYKNDSPFTASQWTTSGDNIYYNYITGSVGIGTASIEDRDYKLVVEDGGDGGIKIHRVGGAAGLRFNMVNDGRNWELFHAGGPFSIKDVTAGKERLTIDTQGNVGIGTTDPKDKLSIGNKVLISSSTNPSNPPSGAVVIYFDGTDLKCKNSSGTVKTIADF